MTSTTSAETCLPEGDIEVCPRPSPSVFDTTATSSPPPSIITTPASTTTPMATQEPSDGDSIMLLEPRPFRPFKTSEEYLYAMKEDLADWLNNLYSLDINVDNFFERLDTGEVLCAHANNVRRLAEERRTQDTEHQHSQAGGRRFSSRWDIPQYDVVYRQNINAGSFFARDNVHNFITWCRDLGIYEVLLFETDDLVLRKNEKHVILSLLEVARRGARFGMAAPLLVQMEADIDREMEQERLAEERMAESGGKLEDEEDAWGSGTRDLSIPEPPKMFYGPQAQVITNDLKSLDEMVRDLVERCSCPSQFPMVKVSEGKYRIGDTRVLIFVRILRNHVMVRVGGGWDTLEHYLDKHDPCRCRQGHRTVAGSRVGFKTSNSGLERQLMNVTYERKRSAGGKVVLIQSSTDRLTMQQAMEKGVKPGSPPPSEQGRTTSPKNRIRDFTAPTSNVPAINMVDTSMNQGLPDQNKAFSSPKKACLLKNQTFVPLKEKSNSEECVLPKQNTPQLVTRIENVSEIHKQDMSSKATVRCSTGSPSTPRSQKEARAALPKGSPKLPLRIKSSLDRSRSSSLPVISPVPHSTTQESKTTHVQQTARVNKVFVPIKKLDEISSKTNVIRKCDMYPKDRETASGTILRSPLSISKATLNKTEGERTNIKDQIPDEFSRKAECLSEQPKPQSKIPVSIIDGRWKTHASRIPKVVQSKSDAVTSHPATENELKVNKRVKSTQQKYSAQNLMKKENSLSQLDEEALQILGRREKNGENAKKSLGGKHDAQKILNNESLKHASSALNEEEICEWEEGKILLNNFGKLTQKSTIYRDVFPDIALKSDVDFYHSQQTETTEDDEVIGDGTYAEICHDMSIKNTDISLQNGTCMQKLFISQNLTEPSRHTLIPHENTHSSEKIKELMQEPLVIDFISQVKEGKSDECLINDTLQDNESKDIEANVLESSGQ